MKYKLNVIIYVLNTFSFIQNNIPAVARQESLYLLHSDIPHVSSYAISYGSRALIGDVEGIRHNYCRVVLKQRRYRHGVKNDWKIE